MPPPILEEMTTLDALRAAWVRVQRGGAAGSDGLTVADSARTAHEDLPRLVRALHHHVRAFLHTCGLHAHAGFLHEARPDHPALASDIVEPFRVLVERLALRLLNRRVLQPDDFQTGGAGGNETPKNACLLGPDARKRFFRAFEKMLSQEVQSSDQKRPVTYRRRLHRSARNVARFVQGEAEFKPFRLR